MWRKEEGNPQAPPEAQTQPSVSTKAGTSAISTQSGGCQTPACVSQGIKIKGDVMGTEDLFIDGVIEGKITLTNSAVTIGPNGTVKAEISAREIVLRGIAEGKFTAEERIQIWRTARVEGELKSERISIEDGAELRGRVEAGKPVGKPSTNETAGRGKRTEQIKATEATAKDATATTPGAATAGAD